MTEVWRVLKSGGHFYLWDVDLSKRPNTNKEWYVVQLNCRIGDVAIETGYSQRWPHEARGEADYIKMAESVGFRLIQTERINNIFWLQLIKD